MSGIRQGVKVTTSDDIFIELNGKRIAGIQNYSTSFDNDTKIHDAFGSSTPVGWSKGVKRYTVDLSRIYLEDTAIKDGIDFHDLADSGFNIVIIKGSKERITYKDCSIKTINENGDLKDKVLESISVQALDRVKSTV